MDTKATLRDADHEVGAGAIPEIQTAGFTMMVCALLVAVCFAAPLFLTLPQALEAAGTAPSAISGAVGDAGQVTFHERHMVPSALDSAGGFEESRLAQWRMRASD